MVEVFGRYELRAKIGQGGMGQVWQAYDALTERQVAVKMLPAELAADTAYRTRFEREARSVAKLQHPHIVPIHGFGEIGGRLFIDMALLDGTDLHTLLRRDGPLPLERTRQVIDDVADALDAAHAVGLVHRDIKPANIFMHSNGRHVYVIDFGIARTDGQDGTTDGPPPGTTAYMAPERYDRQAGPAGPGADIYALTCVLFECLTGRRPYEGDRFQQIAAHLTKPPPRATDVMPSLPAVFDEIIARGMAKNPADRYPTATALANALAASSTTVPSGKGNDRPVLAFDARTAMGFPPVSSLIPSSVSDQDAQGAERTYRRALSLLGRNPAHNAAYLEEAALAIEGASAAFRGLNVKPLYRSKLVAVRPDHSYFSLVGHTQAVKSVAFGTNGDGRALLASGGADLTVRIWDPETGMPASEPLRGHTSRVLSLAFETEGGRTLLASGDDKGKVMVRDLRSPDMVSEVYSAPYGVTALAFGTDKRGRPLLAAGSRYGKVIVWNLRTRERLYMLLETQTVGKHDDRRVLSLAFGTTEDGRTLLASGSSHGQVLVWDLDSVGTPRYSPASGLPLNGGSHTGRVLSLKFGTGSDGRIILNSAGDDGRAYIWHLRKGDFCLVARRHHGPPGDVTALAFAAGQHGQTLLVSGNDRAVRIWDPKTGDSLGEPLYGHTSGVTSVAVGTRSDGQILLASGSSDRTVRIWHPENGGGTEPVGTPLHGHTSRVLSVAFGTGSDGRSLLASTGGDRTVRIWHPETGKSAGEPLHGHRGRVLSVGFGRNGRVLLAAGRGTGTVRIWDAETGDPMSDPLYGHTGRVLSLTFGTSSDGRTLLASGANDCTVRIWDAESGELVSNFVDHPSGVRAVAFGSRGDGRGALLASGSGAMTWVWDPEASKPVGNPVYTHSSGVTSIAFANGNGPTLLAAGSARGTVQFWSPREHVQPVAQQLCGHTGPVLALAFGTSRDGRALLTSAGADHTVRIWDLETGECQSILRRRTSVNSLAINNSQIAIADDEGVSVIEIE